MLRTNNKQARENVRQYIRGNVDFYGYPGPDLFDMEEVDFPTLAHMVLDIFRTEKFYARNNQPESVLFEDWTRGLPSALDCCYWYNRSAVDDLGDILEQTEEERSRYDEEQSGQLLTWLIYRELNHAEREYYKEATK